MKIWVREAIYVSWSAFIALLLVFGSWTAGESGVSGIFDLGWLLFFSLVIGVYLSLKLLINWRFFAIYRRVLSLISRREEPCEGLLSHTRAVLFSANAKRVLDAIRQLCGVQKRLEDSLSSRKDFVADLSHELKTPLFAAQGFILTLMEGAGKDPRVNKKFLKKAAKNLENMDLLIQELFTLSQMESGNMRLNFYNVDLQVLCLEVYELMEGKARNRKQKFSLKCHGDGPFIVRADYRRIYHAVSNLVSNAINYSKDGAKVSIHLKNQGDQVCITVQDTGPGISSQDAERIFQRLYRIDKSRSRKKGGFGLGLAIVKHTMELHGTSIDLSTTLGKGSKFSFVLPSQDPEPREAVSYGLQDLRSP